MRFPQVLVAELLIISLCTMPLLFSFIPNVEAENTKPQRRILSPQYAVPPENQTVEYGTRLNYQLEIVNPEEVFAWYISDTVNFRISTSGVLRDRHVLHLGLYPLFIRVWDKQYSYTDAMIYIHIVDSIYPQISEPDDIEFTKGETGHKIEWEVVESNPESYEIRKSGFIIQQGIMTEDRQTFEVALDQVVPGVYLYTLSVTDIGGNVASDDVIVHIHQDPDDVNSDESGPSYIEESSPRNRAMEQPLPYIDYQRIFATIVFGGLSAMVMVAFLSSRRQTFGFESS